MEEKVDRNSYFAQMWGRATTKKPLKTRLSEEGIGKFEFLEKINYFQVEEQQKLFAAAKVGCLPWVCITGLFIWLIVSLAEEEVQWLGSIIIGTLTLSAIALVGNHVKKIREKLVAELEIIGLDFLERVNERPKGHPPTRYIADAYDAELAAADFMKWLGFLDARATPIGPDGGIDIWASNAIGQVKDYGKPIGRPDIQQHFGIAVAEGNKLPIFFARSGYTQQALGWANERDMPLFEFDLAGSWAYSNFSGQRLWHEGAKLFLENRKTPDYEAGLTPLNTVKKPLTRDDENPQVNLLKHEPSETEEKQINLTDELQKLAELKEHGFLTEEEFQAAKKKIID